MQKIFVIIPVSTSRNLAETSLKSSKPQPSRAEVAKRWKESMPSFLSVLWVPAHEEALIEENTLTAAGPCGQYEQPRHFGSIGSCGWRQRVDTPCGVSTWSRPCHHYPERQCGPVGT